MHELPVLKMSTLKSFETTIVFHNVWNLFLAEFIELHLTNSGDLPSASTARTRQLQNTVVAKDQGARWKLSAPYLLPHLHIHSAFVER
jgi:hypothetical protein